MRYTRAQVLELRDAPLPFVDLRGKFGLTVAEDVAARDAAYAWFAEQVGMVLQVSRLIAVAKCGGCKCVA